MSEMRKTSNHLLNENPIIKKLSKINEYGSETACTYKGIALKLLFFV